MFRVVTRRAWHVLGRSPAVLRAAPALISLAHLPQAHVPAVTWLREGPHVALAVAASAVLLGGAAWCEGKADRLNDERLTLAASEQKLRVVEQLLTRLTHWSYCCS